MFKKALMTVLLLIISHFISAQNYEWKNITKNFQMAIISENSADLLKEKDSIDLTVYVFETDKKIDLNNSDKQKHHH